MTTKIDLQDPKHEAAKQVAEEVTATINMLATDFGRDEEFSNKIWNSFQQEMAAAKTQEDIQKIIFGKMLASEAAFQILVNVALQQRGIITLGG